MLKKLTKKIITKATYWMIRIVPIVIPALLIIHTNSSACGINGQPKPPESLKKYRKF